LAEKKAAQEALAENRKRCANLLSLVEEGKALGNTVAEQINEVERQREEL
jgi:hypothetical protein